jgi:hypothetical protein
MIADVVLSLNNGFENRGVVVPYFYKHNYYDCCLKVGNDLVDQKVNYKNKIVSLRYIPVLIFKYVSCFIGEDSIIELDKLKKDIEVLQNSNINYETLLYISRNTCVKNDGSFFFLKDMDSIRITQLFGFLPNLYSKDEFLKIYSRPLFDSSGGFFSSDGTEFNRFESIENTQSTIGLASTCNQFTGNIIGVFNIFEPLKNYSSDTNDNIIFTYLYSKLDKVNQFIYLDLLLNYSWLNLDKINKAVLSTGATVLCIVGFNIITDIDYIIIHSSGKEDIFHNNSMEFLSKLKKHISKYFKQNIQVNEVLYF